MKKVTISILVFTILLDFIGCFMVLPIFAPLLLNPQNAILPPATLLSTRTLLVGLLIAVYGLGQFFGGPFLGGLSDQIGRKKTLLLGLAILIVGNLIGTLSLIINNIFLLFCCRLLTGIASGNASVIFAAVSTMSENDQRRGINMGYLAGAVSIGCVLGPLVGAYLSNPEIISFFAWYIPFLCMAILFLINALLVCIAYDDKGSYRCDHISLGLGFANIIDCFSMPRMRIMLLAYFFMIMSTESIFAGLPIFAVAKFNISSIGLAGLLAWGSLLAAFSSFYLNRELCKKLNSYQIAIGAMALLCLGYLLFLFVTNATSLYLPYSLVGLMCSLQYAHANAIIADNTNSAIQGKVLGVAQSLLSLAIMIGPTCVGLAAILGPNYIIIFCLSSGLLGLVNLIIVSKQRIPRTG